MSDINKKSGDETTQEDVKKTPDDIVEETMQGILDDMKDEFEELDEAKDLKSQEKHEEVEEEYEEESEDFPKEEEKKSGTEEQETENEKEPAAEEKEPDIEQTAEESEETEEDQHDSGSDDVPSDDTKLKPGQQGSAVEAQGSEDWKAKLEEHRAKKKKKKKIAIISGSIIGGLVLVYAAFAIYFSGHFYFFTKINGTSFSAKTVEQVERHMEQQVADYTLTLEEKNNVTEEIKGSDIDLTYQKGEELDKLLKEQNPFLWITSLWNHRSYEAGVGVEYDSKKLDTLILSLNCMKKENQEKPVSAYPEFNGQEFTIVPEVLGTAIDTEVFSKEVNEHITQFNQVLNLEECECYQKPAYLQDSKEVAEARDKMNTYLKASITYDFSPKTEVVDKSVIAKWLSVNKKMQVKFDKKAVKKYIANLAEKYNTAGKVRQITSPTGKKAKVSGGDFGWRIAQESEYKALIKNIEKGETITREPKYSSKGAGHGEHDYGNTYAEVDLSAQHMWFIKDGSVVLESAVVTGNPNKGNGTPQGSYSLTYKSRNAVLRGTKKPDGTYEYETPVSYWMPFNGGIGFHDATWQPTFGGSRYLSHGSHGCVNLPFNVAKKLYGLIDSGMPVVCHY